MMEQKDSCVLRRRSVREFLEQPVEREKIELLLRAGFAAPSAGGQSEWEFVVVTDKALLKHLALASPYAGPVKGAPLAIVPVADLRKLPFVEFWTQDMAACTENILVQATELGLGSVWLGITPDEERIKWVSDLLHLPHDVIPFAILAIGYAAEEPVIEERLNATKVHINQYKEKAE